MTLPADGVTFGRRGAPAAPARSPAAPTGAQPGPVPTNPVYAALDRVFLWIPGERAPGVPAIGLFLVRQATLPFALMLTPFVLLVLIDPTLFTRLKHASAPSWFSWAVVSLLFTCMCLVLELSRYTFVRRADRPIQALLIFNAVNISLILLLYHSRIYTPAWMIAAEIAASVAIYSGLKLRSHIGVVLAAIIVGHAAVQITAPRLFPLPDKPGAVADSAPATAAPTPASSASASSSDAPAAAPTITDMPSWAKLYPGASVVENKAERLFGGDARWTVQYSAEASPAQIDQFYDATAGAEGFVPSKVLGLRFFRQTGTGDYFSYFLTESGATAHVIFIAKASD